MENETTKKERMESVFSDIDEFEEDIYLPSIKAKEQAERKQKQMEEEEEERHYSYNIFDNAPVSDEDWIAAVSQMPKLKFNKKRPLDLFAEDGRKKKRKGKKKDGATDFKKEFSQEMGALRHLLLDQNEFVNSLQNTYNGMMKQKSSVRGVGKYQTDLIANITSARNVSASLVKQIIDAKKTIADLTMKERKELGLLTDENGNLSDQASAFLKQILNVDRKSLAGNGFDGVEDVDYDEMADFIGESMTSNDDYEERPDEVRKYLKYENRNVTVKVILHNDGGQEFIAVDEDDNLIPDYPLPNNNAKLSINRSTMRAKDEYGVSYELILED